MNTNSNMIALHTSTGFNLSSTPAAAGSFRSARCAELSRMRSRVSSAVRVRAGMASVSAERFRVPLSNSAVSRWPSTVFVSRRPSRRLSSGIWNASVFAGIAARAMDTFLCHRRLSALWIVVLPLVVRHDDASRATLPIRAISEFLHNALQPEHAAAELLHLVV